MDGVFLCRRTSARRYLEAAPDTVDERAFTRQLYGHDYTFGGADTFAPGANEYYVREFPGMWEWRRRAGVVALVDDDGTRMSEGARVAHLRRPSCRT